MYLWSTLDDELVQIQSAGSKQESAVVKQLEVLDDISTSSPSHTKHRQHCLLAMEVVRSEDEQHRKSDSSEQRLLGFYWDVSQMEAFFFLRS